MAEISYTAQQANALSQKSTSVALSAGAGCGKTFVLTQRFLGNLDPLISPHIATRDNPLSNVVAITFTDRAAREMRDRIRKATLLRLQQASPTHRNYWADILRQLESARISTIHSFCSGLLRAHAIDAGLDPQFETLTADQQKSLLRISVRDKMHQLLIDGDADLEHLIFRYSLEQVETILISLVEQRLKLNADDFALLDEESLLTRWQHILKTEFLPLLLDEFRHHEKIRTLTALLHKTILENTTYSTRRASLLSALTSQPDGSLPVIIGPTQDWLNELIEHAKIQGIPTKAWPDEKTKEDIQQLFEFVRKQAKTLLEFCQPEPQTLQEGVRYALMFFRVFQKANQAYRISKWERGCLDFDDLLIETHRLLQNNPTTRQRIAHHIDFLLLDEFQDTDPLQMAIVRDLCGDELTTGKLFFVGDSKQSIYRFRRADPSIFHNLRQEIPQAGRLPLSRNFRSQPEILNFINAIFGDLFADYEPLTPGDPSQYTPRPTIEFLLAPTDEFPDQVDDSEDDADASQPNLTQSPDAEGKRLIEAEWIAARIEQLLSDPTPLIPHKNRTTGQVTLRRVKPGDIVILFAALSNVGLYEHQLRRCGIDYYLVGGQAFFAQQENYDLVNLLKTIDDPSDDVSLLGVLRSPFFSMSDDTIFSLATQGKGLSQRLETSPLDRLTPEQQGQIRRAREILSHLRAIKDRVSLTELLKTALDQTGYDAAMLMEFLGSRKIANLHKLLDHAREFDRRPEMSLAEFISSFSESVEEEFKEEMATTSPETGNLVRLMTIHQSKGLEFPIVFVADMNRNRKASNATTIMHPRLGPLVKLPEIAGQKQPHPMLDMFKKLEQQQDDQESLRLLYVAMTRAADLLILSSSWEDDPKRVSLWMRTLREKFDLATGLPIADPYLGQLHLSHIPHDQIPTIHVHHDKPQPHDSQQSRSHGQPSVPLSELAQSIYQAEPLSFGPLAQPIAIDHSLRNQFSVSELESLLLPATSNLQLPPNAIDAVGFVETLSSGELESTRFGDLVHALLEQVDLAGKQNLDKLITRVSLQLRINPDKLDNPRLINMLTAFLQSPLAQDLKTATTLVREMPFLLRLPATSKPHANHVVTGTIDCLYLKDDRWHLVDYKTGRWPGNWQHAIKSYGFQLSIYSIACQKAFGSLPHSIRLCYFDPAPRFLEIPLTPDHHHEYQLQLQAAITRLKTLPI